MTDSSNHSSNSTVLKNKTEQRTLYFVRHGHPDFPPDEKLCLGTTDKPLGTLGRMQARLAGEVLRDKITGGVFCSPLQRALQTARFLSESPVTVPGLEECYAGEWDGLPFSVIRERYPDIFALRGRDKSAGIPGAEDLNNVQKRFRTALESILSSTSGDIAVVSHGTVIGTFLAEISGDCAENARNYRLPYCGWVEVLFDGSRFTLLERESSDRNKPDSGIESESKKTFIEKYVHTAKPSLTPSLTPSLCRELRVAAELPERICLHCDAVARDALRIADALEECAGISTDRNLIVCASMLHDIARLEKHHEATGGTYIRLLGYPDIGDLIAQHDGPEEMKLNEAAVVYIADKQIRQETPVTVEERYAGSLVKCTTPEAKERHARKKVQALQMKALINEKCGKEIIK